MTDRPRVSPEVEIDDIHARRIADHLVAAPGRAIVGMLDREFAEDPAPESVICVCAGHGWVAAGCKVHGIKSAVARSDADLIRAATPTESGWRDPRKPKADDQGGHRPERHPSRLTGPARVGRHG